MRRYAAISLAAMGLARGCCIVGRKPGSIPLGPENTLGLLTGPFTGTIVPPGVRYMVVAKSPLTGGWGEANSGGFFGPNLKFAGFDAVFFTGISPKPVYLLLDDGKAELKDAGYLWGKDTYETEDILMAEYKESRVVCIGPAGEKLSLVSCIMTNHGDAAGRSGLGAVMGSKKLKAVVARGTKEVTIADKVAAQKFIAAHLKTLQIVLPHGFSPLEKHQKYGTSFTNYDAALQRRRSRLKTGVVSVSLTFPTVPVSTVMFSKHVWRKDTAAGIARYVVKRY